MKRKSRARQTGRVRSHRSGWHEVGDREPIYFRSEREYAHARILELRRVDGEIASWEHEPKRFEFPLKRGTR